MKSVILCPYCPLPLDTGGKREMWKHMELLRSLGETKIVSAATKPVGAGWDAQTTAAISGKGYGVALREESCKLSGTQVFGITYASVCKALRLEKAFGHSNPYHRSAFPSEWWRRQTEGADVAVINYSYWAGLPCECPKVVVLLDLWSDYMWEGPAREIEDLSTADLVIVISRLEEKKLNEWGITNTLWSPPSVKRQDLPLTDEVGCVGSANRFNIEGLRWLESGVDDFPVRVYGSLANYVSRPELIRVGRYGEDDVPYRDCGIILMTTAQGMGMQIKAIEALACGRAIVARRGAMRGLTEGNGAWVEVDTAAAMIEEADRLKRDEPYRLELSAKAMRYYDKHLDTEIIAREFKRKMEQLMT